MLGNEKKGKFLHIEFVPIFCFPFKKAKADGIFFEKDYYNDKKVGEIT